MVLPFKSPSVAQVLPLTQAHRLSEFVFRILAFLFRIAHKQALADGAPLQEPKCCPGASVGPCPNLGILFPNRPQTSPR